ncbi:MAG: glucose PTS transporter subunit IIA [Lachnospiraceae bacterium]|nr:glucose PTS transporter subunit IIA [Lachnospiraceae bacterium]
MKDRIFGILQRVGRSFMLPIAILPVAGLLLGIGGSFTNTTMQEAYGLTKYIGQGTALNAVFEVMREAGDIVFANLPIIFAIGVAIGMAKREKEVAALAAAIAFFIMHASIGAMIKINGGAEALLNGATTEVVGITSLQMGVFGGIIVGLGVASLHNRFYRIELPQVLSFFGGTRFVPIVSALVYTLVGILMFFIWPPIQAAIYAVGNFVLNSGYAGTWVYGLMERLLIPFGLHHVFYLPFWQTAVGGTMEVGGKVIEGAQNIFFAQLADPGTKQFAVSATRFMSGKFPLMIFGLPGAALAMYKTAKPEKKKAVSGLLLSAALTSMLTGITEPLEFTFLFVAPVLYGIHCILAGLAYMLMHLLKVGVGMTFSGGLIDLFLFGILQGNDKTNWIWIPIVGIGYFIVYYGLFSILIQRLDLKTPGRDETEEVKLYRRSDVEARKKGQSEEREQSEKTERSENTWGPAEGGDELSAGICRGLGGKKNISDVDCCATRLRCTVFDPGKVDDSLLKSTGASGVIHKGDGVQIIYGPRVTVIKSNLEDYLDQITGDESEEILCREALTVSSPITGIAEELSKAPDEAFAGKMMGDGAVVTPTDPLVCAPEDGKVVFVFDTKHALGFKTDSGLSLLIHIGIDTVELNGQGFEAFVSAGQRVKKGEPMLRLDLPFLKEHAPSLASPVLYTEIKEGQRIRMLREGKISAGEPLFMIEPEL